AEQIAQAVRQIDPANVEAETIFNASQKIKDKVQAVQGALQRQKDPADSVEPPAPGNRPGDQQKPATPQSTSLLGDAREFRRLRGEMLAKEVARTIDAVNRKGSSDPEAALATLKHTLNSVVSSTDVDPDTREKLRAKVQSSIERLTVALNRLEMERIVAQ